RTAPRTVAGPSLVLADGPDLAIERPDRRRRERVMTDTPDLDRTLDLNRIGAVIFEIDGVVANTAPVHAAAWKHSLDMFLRGRCRARGVQAAPFDVQMDYLRYLDGRTVSDGVREF